MTLIPKLRTRGRDMDVCKTLIPKVGTRARLPSYTDMLYTSGKGRIIVLAPVRKAPQSKQHDSREVCTNPHI
jgi:hypothetical protein